MREKLQSFTDTIRGIEEITAQNANNENKENKKMFSNNSTSEALYFAIDQKAGNSSKWMNAFNRAFKIEYGTDKNYLRKLEENEAEAIKKFAITRNPSGGANIGNLIKTNILTAIDEFFAKSTLLSRVQIKTDTNSYQLPEFSLQFEAAQMGETAAGTEQDSVPRNGDTLTLAGDNNKIKVFYKMSELSLASLDPVDFGTMQARLVRGLEKRIENQIINGTNASGQFAGFINSTTGADSFGAIETTFSIVAGTRPVNHVDAIETMVGDLPADIDDSELSKYLLIVNRTTKTKITRTVDVNNNYYFDKNVGAVTSLLSGVPFYTSSNIATDRVLLADPSKYYILMSTMPKIEIEKIPNTEQVNIKLVAYADGGMRAGYKFLADGTTANRDKNGHRVATLKANYTV